MAVKKENSTKPRRSRGDGGVYKRKSDGLWIGALTIGKDDEGKQIRRTVSGKTRPEAVAKLNELKKQDFTRQGYADYSQIRLSDWIDDCFAKKSTQIRESTLESYQTIANKHIKPYSGNLLVCRIESSHIKRNLKILEEIRIKDKPLSKRTLEYVYRIFSLVLQMAVDEDILKSNPCRTVKKPKIEKSIIHIPSPEEVGTLIAAASPRYSLFFWIAWETGMRRGEILALTWRDIDRKSKTISISKAAYIVDSRVKVGPPKTKSSNRTLPISKTLLAQLAPPKGFSPAGHIFARENGELFYPNDVSKAFTLTAAKVGLKGNTLHHLRHAHAHALLKEKIPMEVVQHRLGHSSIQMTVDLYGHVSTGFQAGIPAILDKLRKSM